MFTFLLLAVAWMIGLILHSATYDQMRRMSYGFEMGKPYTPQEPKPTKPKRPHFQDLMARVKYAGTGAIAISGKIGGTVFSNSGVMGPFIRNWAKPRNVRSAATTLVRGVFSGISSAFKTLTPSQVNTWNSARPDYTRRNVFGDIKHLTPNELFQRINNILTSLGLASVDVSPAVGAVDSVTALAGAAAVGAGTFTLDATLFSGGVVLPANTYAKVYATRQVNASVSSFSKSSYRLIGAFNPAAAIPLNIFTDYTTLFGGLVQDMKISVAIELIFWDGGSPGRFAKTGLTYSTTVVAA